MSSSVCPSLTYSLVTGAARGLGIVLAASLLEAGAHVYCMDILPDPSPKDWAALIVKAEEKGLTLRYRSVDITKPELVNTVMEEIAQEALSPVRILVSAAGSAWPIPFLRLSRSLIDL